MVHRRIDISRCCRCALISSVAIQDIAQTIYCLVSSYDSAIFWEVSLQFCLLPTLRSFIFITSNLLLILQAPISNNSPMITYKSNPEPTHTKALQTFYKIFEDKHKWHIHSSKWQRLKSDIVFTSADQVRAEVIELYSNKEPGILLSISGPVYTNLRELNLKNNRIESIEGLRDIYCQQLRILNLADNHLTQVTRALNKAYLPNLQILILYANNIVEVGSTRHALALNFHTGQQQEENTNKNRGLTELILGVNIICDMRWVNKLSHTLKLQKLSLQNNRAKQNANALKRWHVQFDKMLI